MTSLQGIHTCLTAVDNTAQAKLIELSDANNNTNLNTAWSNIGSGLQKLTRAVSYMMNVDPDTGSTSGTRASFVSNANSEVSSADAAFLAARTAYDNIANDASQSATQKSYAATSRGAMTDCRTGLAAYNPALTYTNPWTTWYPRVFGPHGDFDTMTFHLAQAGISATNGFDKFRQAWNWVATGDSIYTSGTPAECNGQNLAGFGGFCRIWVHFIDAFGTTPVRTMLIFGLIPRPNVTQFQPGVPIDSLTNPLVLVADNFENLLSHNSATRSRRHLYDGLAYNFNNGLLAHLGILAHDQVGRSSTSQTAYRDGLTLSYITTWLHSDGACWEAFKFPNSATLQSLRAAPPAINDPNGPPVTTLYP